METRPMCHVRDEYDPQTGKATAVYRCDKEFELGIVIKQPKEMPAPRCRGLCKK